MRVIGYVSESCASALTFFISRGFAFTTSGCILATHAGRSVGDQPAYTRQNSRRAGAGHRGTGTARYMAYFILGFGSPSPVGYCSQKQKFHTRLYGVMWFWSSATIRKTPNQFLPDCPVGS